MKDKEKNDYNEMINILNNIIKNKVYNTEEEKQLIDDFIKVIEKDRKNKISEFIIENNERIEELYRTINENLKYYIEGKGSFDNYSNRKKRIIEDLNGLKGYLSNFVKKESAPDYTEENKLTEKCLLLLSEKPYKLPYYLDEYIAINQEDNETNKKYELNTNLINKIYEEIKEDNVIEEIEKGIIIDYKKYIYQKIIDKCMESLSYKELINNNSDLIIVFNKIEKEINIKVEEKNSDLYLGLKQRLISNNNQINRMESNSISKLINKNKLETLHKEKEILSKRKEELEKLENALISLHNRLDRIKIELRKNNITDLLSRSNLQYMLNQEEDKVTLTNNLKKFNSKEDIENFYNDVEKQLKINKELLDKALEEEKEFNINASKKTLELMNSDTIDAYSLSRFNTKKRNNIDPRLIFFILKSISIINKAKLKDLNIEESEYKELKEYNDSSINKKIVDFEEDYIGVLRHSKRRR